MRKGWSIVMLALLCGGLTGCNQMGVKQNADSAFEQVRDRFSEQQAFAFHGTTKLVTGDTANGNVVSFSGRKTGDDMLMRVDFAVPEQKQAKSVSLLSKNEQIYVRTEGSAGWKNTSGQDTVFRQEMNNWDPVFAMEQINQMKKSVLPLQDRAPEDDIEAVRILMDSTKLKSWLAEQMKSQASARTQSHAGGAAVLQTEAIHQPRLKYALTLSDGTWNRPRTGATIQATEPPVDEIIDQMELEAEYTIYYNKNTKLPTNMTMSIRSEYDMNDQRVREYTQVETYLQNYGQAIPVPDPTAAGATG